MKRLILASAAALLLPFAAEAQDGALTASSVRNFLATASQRAEEAVAERNWEGIHSWMSEHIADDANVTVTGTVAVANGPTASLRLTMSGEQYKKVGRTMMTMIPERFSANGVRIEGYKLDTKLGSATELPTGAYAARVTFIESGQIGERTFYSEAACLLRFAGEPDDIEIRAATCDVASLS